MNHIIATYYLLIKYLTILCVIPFPDKFGDKQELSFSQSSNSVLVCNLHQYHIPYHPHEFIYCMCTSLKWDVRAFTKE